MLKGERILSLLLQKPCRVESLHSCMRIYRKGRRTGEGSVTSRPTTSYHTIPRPFPFRIGTATW